MLVGGVVVNRGSSSVELFLLCGHRYIYTWDYRIYTRAPLTLHGIIISYGTIIFAINIQRSLMICQLCNVGNK